MSENGAFAQGRVSRYTFAKFVSTFNTIRSTGTALGADDDDSFDFTIPFAFVYDSVTIPSGSTMCICDNGMVGIGTGTSGECCSSNLGDSVYHNAVCVYSADLYHYKGNNYYQVTGSAPNRVLTMEIDSVSPFFKTTTATFQVKLYETSNVIEILFANPGISFVGTDWTSAGIGLNGVLTHGFQSLAYDAQASSIPDSNIRFSPPTPPGQPAELSLNPKSLNFGTISTGSSDTLCVTIKNTGPTPGTNLNVTSMSLSGVSDYSVLGSAPSGIAPGDEATLCIRFSPLAGGTRNATLTISTNGRDSGTQSVTLTGTGVISGSNMSVGATYLFPQTEVELRSCSSESFIIASTGTQALTFTSLTMGGQWPSEYSVTRMPRNPLPAGSSDTVTVSYCPTLEGNHPAALLISTNASNQSFDSLPMNGIGILPRLTITPTVFHFDSVGLGQTVCGTLTLQNPGSDTITIGSNVLSANDGDFIVSSLTSPSTVIPPGGTQYVEVCFTPSAIGKRSANYQVKTNIPLTFATPPTDTSTFNVTIDGIGFAKGSFAIGIIPGIDSVVVGQSLCLTDTLVNTGTGSVIVSGYSLSGANPGDFAISGIQFPATIQAGGRQVFTVCESPSSSGYRNASLTMRGTANTEALSAIAALNVYGILVCASATPNAEFRKPICIGVSDTEFVYVTNCGNLSTEYKAVLSSPNAAYSIVPPVTSAITGPNAVASFTIAYAPSAASESLDSLIITGGTGVTPMAVALVGTGAAATITGGGTAPSTAVGSNSQFPVIINNSGECDWTPGVPASDPNKIFSYLAGATVSVPAGGIDTLAFSFNPNSQGTFTDTLRFPSAEGGTSAPPLVIITGVSTAASVANTTEQNGFRLEQNYPNPFNGMSEIRFTLPFEASVRLDLIDLTGRIVRNLLNEHMSPGSHGTVVSASDLTNGAYYYVLTSDGVRLSRQMLLVR